MNKEYKLPKEFTENWLEKLRSGEYNQVEGSLSDYLGYVDEESEDFDPEKAEKGFCCLGIAAIACGMGENNLGGNELLSDNPNMYLECGVPQILTLKNVVEYTRTLPGILSTLNDGARLETIRDFKARTPNVVFRDGVGLTAKPKYIKYSFNEIADFIEDNVELV